MGYKYRQGSTPDHVNSSDSDSVPTPKIAPRDATSTNVVDRALNYDKKKTEYIKLKEKAESDSTTQANNPTLKSYGMENFRNKSEDSRDSAKAVLDKIKK